MEPIVSVIIATYNRAKVIGHCLQALQHQTLGLEHLEVVIVDDGSTDGTEDIVSKHESHLPIRYLRIPHSGAAIARNRGIRESRGRLLLFIDSDIVASPRLVAEHLCSHQRWPDSVVTGPSIWVSSLHRLPRRARLWDLSTAPFAAGNASVHRWHAIRAGMFDEGFTELGWEDIEFGIRLKRLGLRVRFNPRAIGYHYKPEEIDPHAVVDYARQQGRMAVRFYRKHPCLEVAMATGLNPLAMGIDRLASIADWDLRLASGLLKLGTRHRWNWLTRLAAKQLYNRHYFRAARETLAGLPPHDG